MLQIQDSPRSKLVVFMLEHKCARTFIFQFFTCAFLLFMCFNIVQLPPFEGHPHDKNPFHLIYVALIVYTIICFSAPICGAHINFAVTLAFFSAKKKLQKGDLKLIGSYMIGQLLGCFVGIVLSKEIYGHGGPIYQESPELLDLGKDCVQQLIGTFLLIMSIFLVSNEETTFVYDEAWVHLIVGILYYFCLTFSTHLHIINPSIILTVQLQGMIYSDIGNSGLYACFCLIAAQLLGAFISQLFFMKFLFPCMQKWKSKLS